MRREHPLIVLTVEALARQFGAEPTALWNALDGKPTPRWLVDALVKAYYPGLREADFQVDESLPSVPNGTKMRSNVQGQALIGGREGRPAIDHPFPRWLHGLGMTITEWSAQHLKDGTKLTTAEVSKISPDRRLDRGTAKWWYIRGGRPIPRMWADIIAKESLGHVPATVKTWKNGIREPK